MKVLRRAVAIGLLSGGVLIASVVPSQALDPGGIFGIATEVAPVIAGAGFTVAAVSGAGEIALAGYGIYLATNATIQYVTAHWFPHTGSPTDPLQGSFCANICSTPWGNIGSIGVNTYITGSPPGLWFDNSWDQANKFRMVTSNYVGAGSVTVVGSAPVIDTGALPLFNHSASPPSIQCNISVRNTGTGVIKLYMGHLHDRLANSGTGWLTASSTGLVPPNCSTDIQAEVTSAGIDNTSIQLLNTYLVLCNEAGGGSSSCNNTATNFTITTDPFPDYQGETKVMEVNNGLAYATLLQATTSCTAISGGAVTTVDGATVTASGTDTVPIAPCGTGKYKSQVVINQVNGVDKIVKVLWRPTVPASTPYPLCGGVNTCELKVYYDNGGFAPCDTTLVECQNWSTLVLSVPSKFQCHWGTYTLPTMTSCAPLKLQYQPNVGRNTDGLATTTLTDVSVASSSVHTLTGYLGCAPSGWNLLNPLAYVGMNGCLLEWLFIPTEAEFVTATQTVKTAWTASSVGTFVTAMVAVPASIGDMAGASTSGCAGPTITIPWLGIIPDTVIHPLNACSPPMSQIASLCNTVATIVTIVGGCVLVYNPIASSLGFSKLHVGGNGDGDGEA